MVKLVPHLKVLDDTPVTSTPPTVTNFSSSTPPTATTSPLPSTSLCSRSTEFALRASGMGADWEMVTRGIKEAVRLTGEDRGTCRHREDVCVYL